MVIFLYNDGFASGEEIADKCRLSQKEVKKIFNLLNEISLRIESGSPSLILSPAGSRYVRVAAIVKNGPGFRINFFSPHWLRGRYKIDYAKLEILKKERVFTREELKKINGLLDKVKLVNARKSGLYQVLAGIIDVQSRYLASGEEAALLPGRQKDLARQINLDPGWVCRVMAGRSVVTPWGEEKPLKDFFPSRKTIRKRLVREIIEEKRNNLTDEEIRRQLRRQYGIRTSRRSVADYRREAGFPARFRGELLRFV